MRKTMLFAAAMMAATAPVAYAQQATDAAELSAEEIAKRLLGQSRGLQIAPVTSTAGGTAAVTTATAPAEDDGVIVVPRDQEVNIRIVFDFDSATLRDDQAPKLDTLCTVMKSIDVDLYRIVGHTDATGTPEYNQSLSLLRAEEIKRHLVSDCGIADVRLETQGAGERYLYDPADPDGEVNRRVEFQALS